MAERKLLPTLPRHEPTSMDHTATKCFMECPRKYFYRMVLGRSAPEGEWESVFAWGTSLHKFLEVLYSTGHAGEAMTAAQPFVRPPAKSTFMFQDKERWMLTIGALTKFYLEEKAKGAITVLGIEQPFHIQFPDGITIGGRFDQLIKWNNRVWIRDWKTTSKRADWFANQLDPNDQAMRYIYAASCLTHGVGDDGLPLRVIDGTIFVAITNMKTVGPEIRPITSSRSMTQLRAWVQDKMFIHRQMAMCREEDIWPMNEVACTFCDYRTVCTQPSEAGMEQMLRNAFLLRPWKHEEVGQHTVSET